MKKIFFYSVIVLLAVCAVPSPVAAEQCPAAPLDDDNVYTIDGTGTTTAESCVFEYGNGNLNGQTNDNQDDFLNGPNEDGTNPYYGGGWTSFCSTNSATPPSGSGNCDEAYGFTFTSAGGGGSWSFNGVLGEEYALGVKDGSDPFWAVFLLSNTGSTDPVFYSGTWGIVGGGLSHFAIYDREGSDELIPTPEPGSLLLLGSGLTFAANRFRKRKKN